MTYLAIYLLLSLLATILFCGVCKINEGGL
jgi:hypothetical protein